RMEKTRCALRHADWLAALSLGALLLTVWCQPGRTEHLGADFAWMAGLKGRDNGSCCAVLDCVETTVALLEHDEMESTVMIGETVLTLPSTWVHPSQGPTGMWCFIPQSMTGETWSIHRYPRAYAGSPPRDANAGEYPLRLF